MFRCGNCGAMITNETQKGHVYLRCTKKKGPCDQPYLREEAMTRQVEAALRSVALDPEDADWMLAELRERQDKERQTAESAAAEVRRELSELDEKDQRMLTSYLEGVSSLDEYRSLKNQFAERRATLKERLAAIEASGERRLEPVAAFINAAREAGFAAQGGKDEEKRDRVKNAGSNRRVLHGELVWEPRGAWQIVATAPLNATRPKARDAERSAACRNERRSTAAAVHAGRRSNGSRDALRCQLLNDLIEYIVANPDETPL
jgi:hypothetical protein